MSRHEVMTERDWLCALEFLLGKIVPFLEKHRDESAAAYGLHVMSRVFWDNLHDFNVASEPLEMGDGVDICVTCNEPVRDELIFNMEGEPLHFRCPSAESKDPLV